jgi:hypothetical protein
MKKLFVTIESGKMVTVSEAEGLDSEPIAIPYDLEALTIEQAQAIMKEVENDADYRSFLDGTKEEEVWSSALLDYARKAMRLIAVVGGFDVSAVESLTDEEVIKFAPNFEFQVLRPLYMPGAYEPSDFEGFDFEGVHYRMPLSIADGFGGVMPMADTTAEEWAESNDLRIAGSNPAEYMHLIVAILCRPEGEKYNERVARERAEKFKKLPCKVALDVFFCRLSRMSIFLKAMAEHLESLKASQASETSAEAIPHSDNGSTSSTSQPATATED